jgi:predicted ATPase
MITRIEIDGFKSFRDFAVDLQPFQVLIGPNGVGKSNLFDAIKLLSDLAGDRTASDAFRLNRGDSDELFTFAEDDETQKQVRFAVELLIDKFISDELSETPSETARTRLRYDLHIERRTEGGFYRLYVTHESLIEILQNDDKWIAKDGDQRKKWIKRGGRAAKNFISTEAGKIHRHNENKQGRTLATPIGNIERTILSTINSAEHPTIYAVRREMLNWRFLQFDPFDLRQPSLRSSETILRTDAANLAAVLWRIFSEDETVKRDIINDMIRLVPGVKNIDVENLRERGEFLVKAIMRDDSILSSRLLSDGTLRLLALVALRNDPQHKGVLCFEEPENGVHRLRLEQMIDEVLKPLATNFAEDDPSYPLRQVLVNTHSPILLSHIPLESILLVYASGSRPRLTRAASLIQDDSSNDVGQRKFTLAQIHEYLDSESLQHQLEQIDRSDSQ